MQRAKRILQFVLIAIIVIMLGGLAGWYFFIKGEIQDTQELNAARGFGSGLPPGATGISTSGSNTSSSSTGFFGRLANILTFGLYGGGGGGGGNGGGFLGFGSGGSTTSTTTDSVAPPPPRLWQVSRAPAAGIGFQAGGAKLYYADRANGNVFAADAENGTNERITNTLMPKTRDARFSRDGGIVLRGVSDTGAVTTFLGFATSTQQNAVSTTTVATLDGRYISPDIVSLAVNPNAREVVYLVTNPDTGTVGVRSNWEDGNRSNIFASRLTNWTVQWLSDGRLFFSQKPADGIPTSVFELRAGELLTIMDDVPGLMYLPRPSSPAVLFSTANGTSVSLFMQATSSATTLQLPVATIAEKCVWAPGSALIAYCAVPQTPPRGLYLREWYRGATHTADSWWKIDVSAGKAEKMDTVLDSSVVDVLNPVINDSGTHLAFMNARDMSVWILRIAY